MTTTTTKPTTPGQKAVQTKGPIELKRAGKMAAWTKRHGKDDAKNPFSRQNTLAAFALLLLATLTAGAQINTHCTTNGDQTDCQSIDQGEQNRQAYEAGQQVGSAIGSLLNRAIARHQFNSIVKKQCHANGPGSTWTVHWSATGEVAATGVCTDQQAGVKPVTSPTPQPNIQSNVPAHNKGFTYPECSTLTDPDAAKTCNASLAPDAPIIPACQPLATNDGGTQPETYRYCAAAQAAMAKRLATF